MKDYRSKEHSNYIRVICGAPFFNISPREVYDYSLLAWDGVTRTGGKSQTSDSARSQDWPVLI